MMPATARTSPMESHILLPVMKLPGIRFMPCPANTPPMIRAITPTRIRAMRPVRLVTSPNLPSTSSGRRSDNGPIRLLRHSGRSESSVVVRRVRRRPDNSDPCLSSTPRSPLNPSVELWTSSSGRITYEDNVQLVAVPLRSPEDWPFDPFWPDPHRSRFELFGNNDH